MVVLILKNSSVDFFNKLGRFLRLTAEFFQAATKEAGCEKRFLDKTAGSKAECKGLSEVLAYLWPEDTLVIWKLDRAGRSLTHLIDLLRGLKKRGAVFP